MKQIFFTPGPSQLYPTMADHIRYALKENIPSISHRSDQFKTIYKETTQSLKKLLDIPENYYVVFVSSGTEAMERIIQNLVEEKSFHFVNGSFSKKWFEIALELGKDVIKNEVGFGKGFTKIPEIAKDNELICFTQNETSNGVWTDPEFIYQVKKQYPDILFAVDIVSSAPIVDLDYTKLDAVFFSVQKNFGMPAGLGVIIISPKALKKAKHLQKKKINIGTYHNFPTLVDWANKNQTPETPNVLGIYLFGKIVEDLLNRGIKDIRKETQEKAKKIYEFLENHEKYKPFVEKQFRSQTVIVAEVENAKEVQSHLQLDNLIVGSGYGHFKEKQIRIANFPSLKMKDIERLLTKL